MASGCSPWGPPTGPSYGALPRRAPAAAENFWTPSWLAGSWLASAGLRLRLSAGFSSAFDWIAAQDFGLGLGLICLALPFWLSFTGISVGVDLDLA